MSENAFVYDLYEQGLAIRFPTRYKANKYVDDSFHPSHWHVVFFEGYYYVYYDLDVKEVF